MRLTGQNIIETRVEYWLEIEWPYSYFLSTRGGDLCHYLRELESDLEEQQLVEWLVQICMALQYLHSRNILHRDLKTQNIFLTSSQIIKLGDLGIARVLDSASDLATTIIGLYANCFKTTKLSAYFAR